jgi:hypothetical protein
VVAVEPLRRLPPEEDEEVRLAEMRGLADLRGKAVRQEEVQEEGATEEPVSRGASGRSTSQLSACVWFVKNCLG